MSLLKRKKCQGCKALMKSDEDGYYCELGVAISQRVTYKGVRKIHYSPSPKSECYKPKTMRDLKAAKNA